MRPHLARLAAVLLAAATATALGAPPAAALDSGSPAWTEDDLVVYEGPGTTYDAIGDVAADVRVRVDRCTYQWCQMHTGGINGWVWRDDLDFGEHHHNLLGLPLPKFASGGPGTVCLFEGRDYTGDALCLKPGDASRDLLLKHLDNRYSSVTVEGNTSVTLCRDRDFSSYCERIIASQPRLNGFLDNNVSSYRVH
jgi:hypothetical protein